MKAKVFNILQRIGRSFMLPIAVLPVAGLFLGIGSSFTSESTISLLHLEAFMGKGTFLNDFFILLMKVGSAFFDNLPLIFAASVALGMAKKAKEVAVLSAVIAFFVMHTTINGMLTFNNIIANNQIIATNILEGTVTPVCGILSLEMGVFGGIIVGLGVSFLHNRYYQIQLPKVLSFFEGERFIPIISTIAFLFVGMIMFKVWPYIQNAIFILGKWVATSGYFGTFIYGAIERLLVPFGLHHVFYLPFWQTGLGGSMMISGQMIYGGQNIFFAQLADPATLHFSSSATKYFTGKYILMIFGLPGAALAMYHMAKKEAKENVASLFIPATLTCILTGITEPLEFSFLFAAPMLFGIEVLLAGSAYMVAEILNITIGLTFSGGLIDFFVFGILQGNSKTNWLLIIPIGIAYFILYYVIFRYMIKKYDLKTPGRDENVKIIAKADKGRQNNQVDGAMIDKQSQLIVRGLGGRDNFSDIDCCVTRIRATIINSDRINEGSLKKSGAAAIIRNDKSIQIIYGPKASAIKTKLDEYLLKVPAQYDDYPQKIVYNRAWIEFGNIVDGEVLPIEQSVDPIFARGLLGDGIMIKPDNGLVVSPCDGIITTIYPTKHAISLKTDNDCELLLHFGIDTVNLNGNGFDLQVNLNQRVNKGDLLWNADLDYIKEKATDENILFVITKLESDYKIDKKYGKLKKGDTILKIHN